MITVGNFIRMLVRPLVTVGLISSLIYAGLAQHNSEVITALVGMSGVATTFWFNDRSQQNRPSVPGDS